MSSKKGQTKQSRTPRVQGFNLRKMNGNDKVATISTFPLRPVKHIEGAKSAKHAGGCVSWRVICVSLVVTRAVE